MTFNFKDCLFSKSSKRRVKYKQISWTILFNQTIILFIRKSLINHFVHWQIVKSITSTRLIVLKIGRILLWLFFFLFLKSLYSFNSINTNNTLTSVHKQKKFKNFSFLMQTSFFKNVPKIFISRSYVLFCDIFNWKF